MPVRKVPLHYWFIISVPYDRKLLRYKVEKTYESQGLEHFTVYAPNKNWVFSSDRPLWRNKGVNRRGYTMKLIQGDTWNMAFLEKVIDAIKDHVRAVETFDPNWRHPKNDTEPGKDRRY